jgi:ribosomal protein S18 acetylase RimI-like enzyme
MRYSWIVTTGEQAPAEVDRLLTALPDWFGIESSNRAYVEAARRLPTYLARAKPDGPPVGVLLTARHFRWAAEIYLMAVEPALHRRGVGRALVRAAERDLTADQVRLLQVKTLGPSHPDPGYARTRLFYQGMGFTPLEELTGLWPDDPCLIMVKVLSSAALPVGDDG